MLSDLTLAGRPIRALAKRHGGPAQTNALRQGPRRQLEILNGSLDLAAGGILGRRHPFFCSSFSSKRAKIGQKGPKQVKRGQRGHNGLKYGQKGSKWWQQRVKWVKMGSQGSKSASRAQIMGELSPNNPRGRTRSHRLAAFGPQGAKFGMHLGSLTVF